MPSRSPDAHLHCCSNLSKPSAAGAVSAPAAAATPPPMPFSRDAELEEEHTAIEEVIKDGYKRCCTCKVPKLEEQLSLCTASTRIKFKGDVAQVYRCKDCHSLRGRINTVIQNHGMVDDWDFASEDQKAAFYKKYGVARGSALATAVQLHVEERKTDKLVLNFKGTGQFMDLVDLTEKFKDKPEQLANIKQHGRTFRDHNRGCTLYEVLTYESKSERQQVQVRDSKRSLNSETLLKPAKKAKAAVKAAKPAAALTDGHKPLTKAQKTALTSMKTKFDKVKESLSDIISCASDEPEIATLFPVVVVQAARVELTGAIQLSQRMAELIVGTAAVESVKDFKADIMKVQSSMGRTTDNIHDMVSSICDAAGIDVPAAGVDG